MPKLEFSARKATTHKAIVVSLDLAGFSTFCNQSEPAVANTAPQLVKRVFDSLNEMLSETRDEGEPPGIFLPSDDGKLLLPKMNKFTGDGALMAWLREPDKHFPQPFCDLVVKTMREYQLKLATQLPVWEKEWRVNKLPRKVRIGIATGIVYAVRPPHTFTSLTDPNDYVGYCMNLAVGLQGHCPDLGFLVHGNLHPEIQGMERFTAVKLKGTQDEPVALFKEDVQRVQPSEFKRKFDAPRQ
jgi:class 3 adenylate cyclase